MKLNRYTYPLACALCTTLLFSQCGNTETTTETAPAQLEIDSEGAVVSLPIAYVNLDTLLVNYNYAKDLTDASLRQQENARITVAEKSRVLEGEVAAFQRKLNNNAFLSQASAQQEQQRLARLEAEVQQLAQRLQNEIMMEVQKGSIEVNDSINKVISDYNKVKKFQVILNNAGTQYIDPQYDITSVVLSMLNSRYAAAKK